MFSLVVFLLVLGLLILVHEFGHFIVARKVGIRVERFALGFGKVLLGMNRWNVAREQVEKAGLDWGTVSEKLSKNEWADKISPSQAHLTVNVDLVKEKMSEAFGEDFSKILPILQQCQKGTEYTINAIPLGGYVELAGDSQEKFRGKPDDYLSKSPGKRALVIFFGPLLNYALGFFCFWLIFFAGYPTLTTKVGGLIEGYGAKAAGVEAGDIITAIDGTKVIYWEDMQRIIYDKKDASVIKVSVLRGGKEKEIEVKIKEKEMQDAIGTNKSVGLIGITPADGFITVRHGFIESSYLGFLKTIDLTVMTYKALWRMTLGKLSIRESVTGPLGIFYITSKATQIGFVAIVHLIAVLSISLCIFNLLPLPVLDGGHMALLLIEKIRRKSLSVKVENIIARVGFSLMITLAILVTINDLARFKDSFLKIFIK